MYAIEYIRMIVLSAAYILLHTQKYLYAIHKNISMVCERESNGRAVVGVTPGLHPMR